MDWVALTFLGGLVALTLLIALLWGVRRLGLENRPRCPSCGAFLVEGRTCSVCGATLAPPAPADDAPPEPRVHMVARAGHMDPKVGYLNGRVTRHVYYAALALMVGGIGVRVLGMLEPVGLDLGVPTTITAVVTLVGGLAAFVGFVVLDSA